MGEALTPEAVDHVAQLARLALTDEERTRFRVQLSAVLEHVEALHRLDTSDVPATAHPFPLANVLRADETGPCLDRDTVLAEAPAAESGRFKVPRILGGER